MSEEFTFRQGEAQDAPFLSKCITQVSGGVVEALLGELLPNIAAQDLLLTVVQDASSHYSYQNCILACMGPTPKGLLFAYPAEAQVIPPLLSAMVPKARITPFVDILTAAVPESLYINTLWVAEELRGHGLAKALLNFAKSWAQSLNLTSLSLFVLQENVRAKAFYLREGFKKVRSVQVPEVIFAQHGGGELLRAELNPCG
ncbi:MAG: GNAT family N-acetyltransferase [Desulfovibrionaceae bacterium]|nr:GNAT family N-acetyltransferase [Desulfovibrionaceae bacterium]